MAVEVGHGHREKVVNILAIVHLLQRRHMLHHDTTHLSYHTLSNSTLSINLK